MQSVLDKATRDALISRINLLHGESKAKWGHMNIYQMLKHCTLCEELYLGKISHKRSFIGKIIGPFALKRLLKDDTVLARKAPTSAAFKVKENTGDVQAEKGKWIALTEEYAHYTNNCFVHWFFGKMTREQVGYFVFKHTDHHLRQFGV